MGTAILIREIKQFSVIISLLFLVLPCSIANAAGSASNIRVDYSCPGKVTVTYDLTTTLLTNIKLKYSPDKSKWLDAIAVTGDIKTQTTGTGKTIVWDCFADNVRMGGFYFKIELSPPECVMINGVCWATRNVDEPGTFAANPEDAGKFYQWNRKTAWAATGAVTGWDNSTPAGTTWEKSNDPSPTGWRVPTLVEIETLFNPDKVSRAWTTLNGINGNIFTDKTTGASIFLPAVGYRNYYTGTLYEVGTYGWYWSSTQNFNNAYYLLSSSNAVVSSYNRSYGLSVRCVAE